ncbi:hypothetical protein [Chondrinema litorale]|uniref:hypothetical protein n=1 Tax=Chondrinema litorale TaxID=2994555 RepID=UPI002543DC5B|nr:hypothetical protein [Chondrinema litorale]UZR94104.1 hypothetical protein OQ292_19870 [Chondrinema litorale]
MKLLSNAAKVNILIGTISFLVLLLAYSSFTDILSKSATNAEVLSEEQFYFQLATAAVTLFHISTFVTLYFLFKYIRKKRNKPEEIIQ